MDYYHMNMNPIPMMVNIINKPAWMKWKSQWISYLLQINFIGAGIGDYPHLPDIPVEQRDINYPYDHPEHRRNFGEPVSQIILNI